jgi:hypothetical protein
LGGAGGGERYSSLSFFTNQILGKYFPKVCSFWANLIISIPKALPEVIAARLVLEWNFSSMA